LNGQLLYEQQELRENTAESRTSYTHQFTVISVLERHVSYLHNLLTIIYPTKF